MTFDELTAALSEDGSRSISWLAQILLEYCRDHAVALRTELGDLERSNLFADHRRLMQAFFTDIGEEQLEKDDLKKLAAALRACAQGTTAQLAVRATVEGLDGALAPLIVGSFRQRSVLLRDLPLVPFAGLPMKTVLGQVHLSTRPETVEPALDRTASFGLAPRDLAGVEITMDWTLDDLLAPLKHDPGLAIGDPGTVLADMDLVRYSFADRPVFFRVRPRAKQEQRERILRLVEQAVSRSCRVLVFPELSVDDDTLGDLRGLADRPLVVVAGSRHTPLGDHGPGDNVAVTFVGASERTHTKFRPFELNETAEGERVRRIEHLTPRDATFTVHLSQRWSFAVFVCKDFLSPEVQRLLVALRVSLVLVPTLSLETEDFRLGIEHVAFHGQSLVVVANEPTAGSFFGHPIRGRLANHVVGTSGRATLHVLEKGGVTKKYLTDA